MHRTAYPALSYNSHACLLCRERCLSPRVRRRDPGRITAQRTPGQRPPSPCDEVTAAEAASAVRAAVRELPDSQRRVVELAYFGGLTCREVALAAGIPEGTAKSRLRLALARLETVLDRQLLESS